MLTLFCPEDCLLQRENQKVITLLFRLLCGKMHHLSGPHLSCCIKQQEQKLTQSFAKKMSMEHRTHSSCRNDTQTVAAIIITTIIITIISTVVSTLLLWIPFHHKNSLQRCLCFTFKLGFTFYKPALPCTPQKIRRPKLVYLKTNVEILYPLVVTFILPFKGLQNFQKFSHNQFFSGT